MVRVRAMLQEDKQILWRASAVLMGMALPSMLIGKSVVYVLLVLGIFTGLMATKDESLRATLRLLVDSRVTALGLVLMASLLVGVSTGINVEFAFERWFQVGMVGLGAAALFVALREMPGRHLELLLKVLAIGTVVVAGIAMIDAMAHSPRLSAAIHGDDMALTPYRLNFMSSVLAVVAPFVWARLMIKSREGEPFAMRIALPAATFLFMAALICGGRAGWAGLLVGTLLFLVMAGRYHGLVIHKKHWLLGAAAIVGSMALYAVAFGWQFMVQRATIVGEVNVGRGILSGRGDVWAQAIHHIWDKPLFGIGVMNYRKLPDAVDLHPHNWLLQMLLEGGIVSTVLFIGLIGCVMWRFNAFAKGNLYGVAALTSLTAFMVCGLANTSIFNSWWLTFLVVICMLGWRAGWGGNDLKKRRRIQRVVKSGSGV